MTCTDSDMKGASLSMRTDRSGRSALSGDCRGAVAGVFGAGTDVRNGVFEILRRIDVTSSLLSEVSLAFSWVECVFPFCDGKCGHAVTDDIG